MRKGLWLGGVLVSAVALVVACGSSDEGGGAASDAGAGDAGKKPGTSSGDPEDDSGAPEQKDASTASGPNLLVAGAASILGITDEGDVVYLSGLDLMFVPLKIGATATKIATVAATDRFAVRGNVVAHWSAITSHPDTSWSTGTLDLWTKAGGLKTAVAADSLAGFFDVSADDAKVLFTFGALAGTDRTANMAVTPSASPSTTAGTTTAVVAAMNALAGDCDLAVGFIGNAVFAAYCDDGADRNDALQKTAARLVVIPDAPSPAAIRLDAPASSDPGDAGTADADVDGGTDGGAPPAPPGIVASSWYTDSTGAKVFFVEQGLVGRVATVASPGVLATIDTGVANGFLSGDGKTAYWRTTGGALKSAPATDAPAITTLVASGYRSTLSLARDGQHVAFYGGNYVTNVDTGDYLVDLHVADTKTASQTPLDLVADETAHPFSFTSDSKNYLYLKDLPLTGAFLGTLEVVAPTLGATPRELAKKVAGVGLLGNSLAVYTDNVQKNASNAAILDVHWFDTLSAAPPALLAAGVDVNFFRLQDGILFTRSSGPEAGLYVIAVK